ncbi:MAG TPA: hypothetical protein VFV30_05575, partial [Novosphingobium sp.]|nr:hypothetical protein [Novosphingobium sp.]
MDILGTSGNDILDGTSGNDLIVLGGGVDTVHADDGDDEIVIAAPIGNGSVIDGGLGFDTMVIRPAPGYPSNAGPDTSGYIAAYPTSIYGVEAMRFESVANSQLYMAVLHPVVEGGLTTMVGGAGADILLDVVFAAGTYTMANYSLSNWTNDINDPNYDYVSLYVAPGAPGDFTLIAREGLQSVQSLFAGAGNDTLIGSSGSELLTAGAGFDQLFGNGGDDRLFADNLTAYGASPTVRSFSGVFDGGDGNDVLAVGGIVDLTGATISNIETLSLLGSFAAPFPGGNGRAPASVTLNASQIAAGFGASPVLAGTGLVNVQLASGQSFNASAWQFSAGSDITVNFIGTSGTETITGTTGDDVILPAGGVDTIHADAGNDEIVLTAPIGAGSILDGGIGYDTLVLRPQSTYPNATGGTVTQYNAYFPTQIQGLEAVRFESNPGDFLSLVVLDIQRAGSGMTTFIGGAGRDMVYDIAHAAGTYTMPEVSFSNWNTTLNDPNSDFIVLFGSAPGDYVLNAREGLGSNQGLIGNAGNDILNGSSGSDSLDGRGGVNQLYGNGGNDWLFAENRTYFGEPTTTFTFAGNIFDGGSGDDLLLVGGMVNFQGTLSNLEGIYFQPSFGNSGPGTYGIAPAHLILGASNAYAMPGNTRLGGVGTLQIDMGTATVLNLSGYQYSPGANVQVI